MTLQNPMFPADAPEAVNLPAHASAGGLPPDVPHDALAALARLREEAAREVERLLAFLDATDGDPDLEDDSTAEEEPDGEPSLGWTDAQAARGDHGDHWLAGDDRELDDCDQEDDDPAGGDVLDEPHDEHDEGNAEPLLSVPETGAGSQLCWRTASNDIEGEAGIGPSPAKIAAAQARYDRSRSNIRFPDGRMYDAKTGEPIAPAAPVLQQGILVEDRYGSLTLRGPDGKRYSFRDLRRR